MVPEKCFFLIENRTCTRAKANKDLKRQMIKKEMNTFNGRKTAMLDGFYWEDDAVEEKKNWISEV